MIIKQGATVLTPNGYTGMVLDSFKAINGKYYALVHLNGVTKNATRKYLTEKLTVLDNG
jgi:hypothetical protein